MKRKPVVILPLASALGALAGSALVATDAQSAPSNDPVVTSETVAARTGQKPNMLVSTGESLLGFTMTQQPDGTVVAQHASHASHASMLLTLRMLPVNDELAPLIWWWNLVPMCRALELCKQRRIG